MSLRSMAECSLSLHACKEGQLLAQLLTVSMVIMCKVYTFLLHSFFLNTRLCERNYVICGFCEHIVV